MDNKTKEQRSYNMASVKSKNTKPELIIRKILFKQGFRYRLHAKKLPGSPDIVLAKYKTVIFINGCFWHGHRKCKKAKLPKTNVDFWKKKIEGTKTRDKTKTNLLKNLGWHCLICWECYIIQNKYSFLINNDGYLDLIHK